MTTDTTDKPAFYIFTQQDGRARCIGAAFRHKTGKGYNLVIHRQHYLALAPKASVPRDEEDSTSQAPAHWSGVQLRRAFNRKASAMKTTQHAPTRKGGKHDHALRPTL